MKSLLENKKDMGIDFTLSILTVLSGSTTLILFMFFIVLIVLILFTIYLNKNLKDGNKVKIKIWLIEFNFGNDKPPPN